MMSPLFREEWKTKKNQKGIVVDECVQTEANKVFAEAYKECMTTRYKVTSRQATEEEVARLDVDATIVEQEVTYLGYEIPTTIE